MAAIFRTAASSAFRTAAAATTLAAVLVLASVLPLASQARTTGAAGQIVDATDGAPLANVFITIEGSPVTASTDEAGRFTLALAPGQYRARISHIGYVETSEGWWVGDGVLNVTVALERREIVLPEVVAKSRPIDLDLGRRVPLTDRRGEEVPQVWGESDLSQSGALNMADFVLGRLSLVRVPCRSQTTVGAADEVHDCVRIRGQARRICVAMDEAALPGGLSVLASYRPRDLARVMAYRGGEFVMVYTKSFVYNIKAYEWRPIPVSAQMNAFCRRVAVADGSFRAF